MGLSPLAPLTGLTDSFGSSAIGPDTSDILNGFGLSSSVPASPTGTTTQTPSLLDSINSAGQAMNSAVLGTTLSLFGINAQSVTVILGLILIAGGIFLFKPVQQIVVGGARATGRAARAAAVA
jgi:hypothetical protein